MKKRCKEYSGYYQTKDQRVVLHLNHKDIEAIEDIIFTSEEPTKSAKNRINKFWKQLCDQEEKWEK